MRVMNSHAVLIEGNPAEIEAVADEVCTSCGVARVGNPDVRVLTFEKLLVGDVRELQRVMYQTPVGGGVVVTVLGVEAMDHEAQNALLKITEEPPAFARVVLVVPRADMLLPTLRSRFVLQDREVTIDDTEAEDFLKKAPSTRLKLVEKIHKDKDGVRARALIDGVERVLGKVFRSGDRSVVEHLHTLAAFRQDIRQRGVSMKMLLEHLALTLPKVK